MYQKTAFDPDLMKVLFSVSKEFAPGYNWTVEIKSYNGGSSKIYLRKFKGSIALNDGAKLFGVDEADSLIDLINAAKAKLPKILKAEGKVEEKAVEKKSIKPKIKAKRRVKR